MQPIEPNGQTLRTHLGIIARNGLQVPLTYAKWTDMPEDVLEWIWKEVKDNTDAPPEFKDTCLKIVGARWKEWKHRVKKDNYDTCQMDAKQLSFIPSRVEGDQWRALVKYWGKDNIKARSQRNKINREHGGAVHRTGRTTFADVKEKMKANGEETGRVSVFIKTRKTKNGAVPNPDSCEIITELEAQLSQVPITERTPALKDKIFVKVMGDDGHGRVRNFGLGPSPTDLFGQSSRMPSSELIARIRDEVRGEFQAEFDERVRTEVEARVRAELNERVRVEVEVRVRAEMDARFQTMQSQLDLIMQTQRKTGGQMGGSPVNGSSTGHV